MRDHRVDQCQRGSCPCVAFSSCWPSKLAQKAHEFPFSEVIFLLKGLYFPLRNANSCAFLQLVCEVLAVLY